MIILLKRLRFVTICGLFIPFSVFTSSIWLATSVILSMIGYIMIPFEYVITGNTTWCDKMMDFFWFYLPKFYDKQSELFFKYIHPNNDSKVKSE
jgi:hypothetical protein